MFSLPKSIFAKTIFITLLVIITFLLFRPIERLSLFFLKFEDPVILEYENYFYRDLNRNGRLDVYEDSRNSTSMRVEDLLAQMTISEKVGQMMHPALSIKPNLELKLFQITMGLESLDETQILKKHITHFNFYGSPTPLELGRKLNYLQRIASRSRLGIPLSISSDPLHEVKGGGVAAFDIDGFSKWPSQLGLAATRDTSLVEKFGQIAATEYRSVGIHTALHPMADLATDPRWARNFGTFGSDSKISSEMTAAYMRGFQGTKISSNSVITMVKHFPGGGPQEFGLDAHLPSGKNQVYPGGNFEYHLFPFKKVINEGLRAIMPYYGIPKGQTSEDVAMGFNRQIITDILRDQLNFDGVVCSDWGIISGRPWGVEHLSEEDRFKKSLLAGVDQFGGESDVKKIIDLVNEGEISEERIDISVRRLLQNKFDLGLFEQPFVDESQINSIVSNEKHRVIGLKAQQKSLVLLKNGDTAKSVLPIGRRSKIFLDGLSNEIGINYGEVVTKPDNADFIILNLPVVANGTQDPGSNKIIDKLLSTVIPSSDLNFSPKVISKVSNYSERAALIIIVNLNRPAILSQIDKFSDVLIGSFGVSDEAIFRVLFGDSVPVAKLPFEIPSSMDEVRMQKEDLPDDTNEPSYEFGFGLTY